MNKRYFGANLEILREMPDERVHLIICILSKTMLK